MNQQIVQQLKNEFPKAFETTPRIFCSPGRVNIIGEHTDYNEGYVLPAAIDKAIYVAIAPREDQELVLQSLEFGKQFKGNLDRLAPVSEGWPNYILGVAHQMMQRGAKLKGFNLMIQGDVPIGSGLSSSAALECAVAFALNEIYSLGFSRPDLAFIAQKAEHEFAGVKCGIMDQFASVFGKADHCIQLDCRSIHFDYIPLQLDDYRILLLNTNVKHSLASSAYNERREQCEQGVAWVKEREPGVKSLRDVTTGMLEKEVKPRDPVIYKRCRFVVEENLRLLQAVELLQQERLHQLGGLLYLSHEGLSSRYEVSCRELDFLVDQVRNNPDVLGARMMGGGFGGCTINLVRADAIDKLVEKLQPVYKQAMGLDLDAYVAVPGDGSREIIL